MEQWELAAPCIKIVKTNGEICFINNIVWCELVWVLETSYKLSQDETIDVLDKILRTNTFDFENIKSCLVLSPADQAGKGWLF